MVRVNGTTTTLEEDTREHDGKDIRNDDVAVHAVAMRMQLM
jgi:hypothetical protein